MKEVKFFYVVIVCFSVCLSACTCSKKDVSEKSGSQPQKEQEEVDWPKADLAWKTTLEGRLWPLVRIGDVAVLVSSTGEGRVHEPDRLIAVDTRDGTKLWETESLLAPGLVRKTSPWSFSAASGIFGDKKVVAYLRKEGKVTALDAVTGERLWTTRSPHGVSRLGKRMVVSNGRSLDLVDAVSGKRLRSLDLSREEFGAGAHGLKSKLEKRTILQPIDSNVLVTRGDGGELQLLNPRDDKIVWRFDEGGTLSRRLLWLPMVGDMLLIPAGYPNPQDVTQIFGWDKRLHEVDPKWEVSFPGVGFEDSIKEKSDSIVLRLRGMAGRQYLAKIKKAGGRKEFLEPISAVEECKLSGQNLLCRVGGNVVALNISTRKRVWRQTVGSQRDPLFRIWVVDRWVIAVTAFNIWVMDKITGKVAWQKKKQHKNARYVVRDIPGKSHGRFLFVVDLPGSSKSDVKESYLLAMSESDGELKYSVSLGVGSPHRRARRVGSGWVSLDTPVQYFQQRDVLFAGVGGHFRLVRGRDGVFTKEYTHPGTKEIGASLLATKGEIGFIEAGDWVITTHMPTASILWRQKIGNKEITFFGDEEIFWKDAEGKVGRMSDAGASRLSKNDGELIEKRNGEVLYANERFLVVRTSESLFFVERGKGEIKKEFDSPMKLAVGEQFIFGVMHKNVPADRAGVYLGVNKNTGKTKWKKVVDFETESDSLPAPVLVEKRWPVSWVRGAGGEGKAFSGMFLTTDTMGRCVISFDARSGKRRWDLCFNELTGPPVLSKGYLFVTAKGLPKGKNNLKSSTRDEKDKAPKGGSLFAIRLRDGKSRLVLKSEKGRQLMIGHIPPTQAGRLLMVDAPVEKGTSDNRLLGVDLWK